VADLIRLVESHGLSPHMYADDTQVYGSCWPGATAQLQSRVSSCITDVAAWMRSNRLQLNTAKTEVIWCASARRQHQLPTTPLIVGSDAVIPVCSVWDLGIHLDSYLTMRTHIAKTISGCFAVLRQILSIRRSVTAYCSHLSRPSCCRSWTIAVPCWPAYRAQLSYVVT
jgi:hypothetical protein